MSIFVNFCKAVFLSAGFAMLIWFMHETIQQGRPEDADGVVITGFIALLLLIFAFAAWVETWESNTEADPDYVPRSAFAQAVIAHIQQWAVDADESDFEKMIDAIELAAREHFLASTEDGASDLQIANGVAAFRETTSFWAPEVFNSTPHVWTLVENILDAGLLTSSESTP